MRKFADIMPPAALGQALRQIRQQRGETLRQVADRAGYSHNLLGWIESGKRAPSLTSLACIVCALAPTEPLPTTPHE